MEILKTRTRNRSKKKKRHVSWWSVIFLLVGAAAGFHWNACQSGGPTEHVGALWRLPDELWDPLNE